MKKHIEKNSTVIIGVSGGPDSVYLLYKALELNKTHPFKIIVAHINHKLRGRDSDLDQKFVHNLAQKHNLIFELKTLKKIPAGNLEEQCRKARYSFFETLREKHRADWIIIAHQQDDQIETVLFNLIRGSFLDGLKGMQISDSNRHILRPLLNTSKSEILTWLKSKRITYRLDKTNQQINFSRNLLRHKAIPVFKKINSNFEKTFLKNLVNIKEASQFINNYAERWLSTSPKVDLNDFLKLERFLQKTVLANLYRKLNGSSNNLNQQHLEQILQILAQKKSNRKKEFGGHFIVIASENGKRIIKFIKK